MDNVERLKTAFVASLTNANAGMRWLDHDSMDEMIAAAWVGFEGPALAAIPSTDDGLRKALNREVIAEANNSLYGSQGYFITTADGHVVGAKGVIDPPDKYHLARRIERLKADSRAAGRALRQLEQGLSNDALDTLRDALASKGEK